MLRLHLDLRPSGDLLVIGVREAHSIYYLTTKHYYNYPTYMLYFIS